MVFNKLLPGQKRIRTDNKKDTKFKNSRKSVFQCVWKRNVVKWHNKVTNWKNDICVKRKKIGRPTRKEEPIQVLYDSFDVQTPHKIH